jgi:opine dehydrogenase
MKEPKIAVLGAGNVGLAIAGHMALKGHSVRLFNRWKEEIAGLLERGGIEVEGHVNGFASLEAITTDIEEAIKGAGIVMVTTPAFGHRYMAETSAPFLEDGQVVVLQPGSFGGALEFATVLKEKGCTARVIVAETETSLYSCRIHGPALVHIRTIKHEVPLAALPATQTARVLEVLAEPFENRYKPSANVLETGLNNGNYIYHLPPCITSFAAIERAQDWSFYEGVTPGVATLIELIDQERVNLINTLGLQPISFREFMARAYGAKRDTLMETIHLAYSRGGASPFPKSPSHRFITEDAPYGAVPAVALGKELGVEMPVTRLAVDLLGILCNRDFWAEGRNIDKLGLGGLSVQEIRNLVERDWELSGPTAPELSAQKELA